MMGGKPGSHFTTDGSAPTLTRGRGSVNDVHAIALDGDKLKPREDQSKGGNGFGINEEGAGYTLTGVDRHGVAYGINNQGGAAPQFTDETSGTMVAASNSSGNNLHGVAYENDHLNRCEVAKSLNGDHDDRVTDTGTSVVHVGMAQNTRDEVRIVGDGKIVGALPAEPGMKQQTYVVSTNSNGGDVAATINANMSKLGGDNQTTFGGGYVMTRNLSASGATCSTPERTPPSPPTSASASSLPSPQEPRRAQSAQG